MNIETSQLLNLDELQASKIFAGKKYPWEVLGLISNYIIYYAQYLPASFKQIEEFVWVGKGTKIDNNVLISGPTIIGEYCEIRHGAFIRGSAIIGNEVIIGNSTEIKNSILFNKVQVPHYNYIGDSILGYKAHLGAGVKLSNLKADQSNISVGNMKQKIKTNMNKMGAIIGDNVEIGCNAVLNPGTVVGRYSIIYPLTFVRGVIPEKHILKNNGDLVTRE